jgi:hypothetical protein
MNDRMNNHLRFGVIVALAVVGNASASYAQTTGSFHRVTTVTRNGRPAAQPSRTARMGDARIASRSTPRDEALHPYRTRALAQAQAQQSLEPRASSWQNEPAPVVASPQRTAPKAQSHNYYPTLRPGLAVQQPVTLTARSGFLPIQTCTGGGAMAGVARHR